MTNLHNHEDPARQPSEFEIRRAELVGQIGDSLEQVLTQINALNRSLEGIIEIGNEFSQVEALWSQFEDVMGSNGNNPAGEEDRSQERSDRRNGDAERSAKG
ncbi:Dolichyl-diphosphooligosaccharide-protein glycosyltransferase subunit dad1 [Lithohypha guttulata]|uniref:DASH complex subunit DAD1 n=1 Tax=Lithohypha guttulata TaxID=1690604 RepID=A0AAN7SVX3_9EURO|nr:Dolichyl-diphosphooligosaccharide-protein glycosyltransferase subunit dad1 [Lithohypha guttulata]